MVEPGKYIYGIIDSNTKKSFGPFGIGAQEPLCRLVSEEVEGTAGKVVVYTIPYQDISAIVSDKEIVDYTRMPNDAVARLLVGHQKVIEEMMSLGYSIIPMRLGTFTVDEAEVKDILNKGYAVIKDIAQKIRDKIEIDVIATWSDFASVLKEIGENKEIKEFKERLLSSGKGITVDDQIKVGVMIKDRLGQKREKCANGILEALTTLTRDFRVHALMDDRMVMNTAFLINKDKHEDFYRKVEQVNNQFTDRLNFKCVGPLPPYSFYTLEIKKIKSEEIDWAKEILGLNGFVTKDEIKKAYHRSALSSHPDRRPDTPGMEKEFDNAAKAYKIVGEYCLAAEQAGQGDGCYLDAAKFKRNTILVKVKE